MPKRQIQIGVKYDFRKQPDGRFTLLNFPIFQETIDARPAKAGQKAIVYDKDFLADVVKFHQKKEMEGHAPSTHIGHNEKGAPELEKVGTMSNFRLGNLSNKATIFVDIMDVEPADFKKLKRGKLPHFSVEIPDPSKPRIGSGAFLSSRAPFFTLPNCLVGNQVFKASPAFFHANNKHEIIFSLETYQMADEEKKKDDEEQFQDELLPEEEGMEEGMEEAGGDLESRVDMLEQKMDKILEMVGSQGEEAAPEPIADVEDAGMSADAIGSKVITLTKAMGKFTAAIERKVGRLENANKKMALEKEIERAINHMESQAIAYGDPQDFRAEVTKRYQEQGPQAAQTFIQDTENMCARFSPDTGVRMTGDEVDQFTAEYKGEEKEVAREAARQALSSGEDVESWVRGQVNYYRVQNRIPLN